MPYQNPDEYHAAQADAILGMSDEELNGSSERTANDAMWINTDEILYEAIQITSANVRDKFDSYSQKNKTYAYVNFYLLGDEGETPYVFRSAWSGIVKQVAKMAESKSFPACGLIESLSASPIVGNDGKARFPLRFVAIDQLDDARNAATEHDLRENAPAPDPTPDPTPSVPRTAPRPPERTAVTKPAPRASNARG